MSRRLSLGLSLSLSLLAALVLLSVTRNGIGLLPDSVTYIQGARDILRNGNFGGIGTHYPPLYFLFLTAGAAAGDSDLSVIRYLHVALFALNTWLVGMLIERHTGSRLLSLLGMLVHATAATVVLVHALALSEPLFLTFLLLNLHLLGRFDATGDTAFLVVSALLAACAFLTRYVGVAVVVGGIVTLLLSRLPLARRLSACALYGAVGVLPMAVWIARNMLVHGEATSRSLFYHALTRGNVETLLGTISGWFHLGNGFVALAIAAGIAIVQWGVLSQGRVGRQQRFLIVASLAVASAYVCALLVSLLYFDAHTTLDDRVLVPVYLCLLLGGIPALQQIASRRSKLVPAACSLALSVFLLAQGVHLRTFLAECREQGIGYSSSMVRDSETLGLARALPGDAVIYTNGPDILSILLRRRSAMLPMTYDPETRRINEEYGRQVAAMRAELERRKGAIVYFGFIDWRRYLPEPAELASALPAGYTALRTRDGWLFVPEK